jgi:hypothetical protein
MEASTKFPAATVRALSGNSIPCYEIVYSDRLLMPNTYPKTLSDFVLLDRT